MASNRFASSRTATPTGTSGSMTTTHTEAGPSIPINGPTLRLRAESDTSQGRHVVWAEDVIDNEGMGKKSSKVCCIYHKPKTAGDASSDESSSDSDSSDSDPDLSRAQPAERTAKPPRRHHDHDANPAGPSGSEDPDKAKNSSKGKGKLRDTSPNAYERIPRSKKSQA
ncbi:hypothetical protein CAC42_2077 [Sphaceloma murrayae]|uniref:Type 1 phosphatases regulator n=1 Tax=Sphaceloma murrayae TaxID=2082308 RepID=A0A2K1QI55_9PEZI|nr:hypothetical protein CAC42_2077 [Sphaceloma murrayae]